MSVVSEGRARSRRGVALDRCRGSVAAVSVRVLLALCLGMVGMAGVAPAQDGSPVLDRARALEAESLSLLHGHHAFEASLLSPDSDRLTVFLTMPHGARVILNEATLYIDGKKVLNHFFSVNELQALRDRASLILFATRLAPGQHNVRLDLKTMQGNVAPMKTHGFAKGRAAKFIEIQIAGYDIRQPFAVDW